MSPSSATAVPPPPTSQPRVNHWRHHWSRWRDEPNPLWMREMRQSARLTRTPVLMMVVTIVVVLIMASMGGAMTGSGSSAEAGQVLFHLYFSLAYAVVALVGPALAANSIASERQGQTWEAIMLTGMSPAVVARGKFLAAFTAIGQYVIMLAPAGAIPFLFGGVGPFEVVIAFIILLAIAALGCTFGLAISARMQSLRSALLVTIILAVPLSSLAYFVLGVGGATVAHEVWPILPDAAPIWLPVALSRAPLGYEYVAYLIIIPLAILLLPTWLLYELTRANLSGVHDDRTLGIKVWYLVCTIVLTLLCLVPALALSDRSNATVALIAGALVFAVYIAFCVFLFAGEPIGPSRRVRALLATASRLRRAFAPGVAPAASLQVIMTVAGFATISVVGISWLSHLPVVTKTYHVSALLLALGYCLGFALFLVGLGARLRARAPSSTGPRILLVVFLVVLLVGPWIIALIVGLTSNDFSKNALIGACLSPGYVVVALASIDEPDGALRVLAAALASGFYALVGMWLYLAALRHCRITIAQHQARSQQADRLLAQEDQQRAQQHAGAAPANHQLDGGRGGA